MTGHITELVLYAITDTDRIVFLVEHQVVFGIPTSNTHFRFYF